MWADPPVVVLSTEPRSVLEGERVTFTCQATANPPVMGYKYVFLIQYWLWADIFMWGTHKQVVQGAQKWSQM